MTPRFEHDAFYLAFDTSGGFGAVAVGRGGDVIARASITRRGEQAARLAPTLGDVLDDAGIDRDEVAGVIVGEGPGSFTGVRVAAATAKGLAAALGLPVWAVSSLAAAALAPRGTGVRYVLFDARAERVYGACYEVGTQGVSEVVPPHGGDLRDVLASDLPPGCTFHGDGAHVHRAAIEGAGFPVVPAPASERYADGLLAYMAFRPDHPPIEDPASWEPRYIRDWEPGP